MVDALLGKLLIAAAREFNSGRYFEAHEVLEDGLDTVPDDLWDLVLGLIQVAVGYHKVSRGLLRGATQAFGRALAKLEGFPPRVAQCDLESLRRRVRLDIERLRDGHFDTAALALHPPRLRPVKADQVG